MLEEIGGSSSPFTPVDAHQILRVTTFEYILPLVAIVVGLGLANLLTSLHRLISARREIRWDWLPLAWTALCFLIVLQFWWDLYLDGWSDAFGSYAVFLLFFVRVVVLYLALSAVLPDRPMEGLDLREYHERNTRYLFGLGSAYILLSQASFFVTQVLIDRTLTVAAFYSMPTMWIELAGAAGTAGLAATQNRKVHVWTTGVLGGLFVMFLALSLREIR